MQRNRWIHLLIITFTILLGLGSRHFARALPSWVHLYFGDILWGLMVYLWCGLTLSKRPPLFVGVIAAIASVLVEASQLYHGVRIDGVRHTRLGGLILGCDFSWSDIGCYIGGIFMGLLAEYGLTNNKFKDDRGKLSKSKSKPLN